MSKGSTSKITCKNLFVPILIFYPLVWNVEVSSIYSHQLEPLTSMCKYKLMILSRHGFLRVASILFINTCTYSCLLEPSHEAMINSARVTKYLCPAYYFWYGGDLANAPIPNRPQIPQIIKNR